MEDLRRDLTLAVHILAWRPRCPAVATVSLAVGIGATTTLFSVVNMMVLRPLPGVDGYDRAVELGRPGGPSGRSDPVVARPPTR